MYAHQVIDTLKGIEGAARLVVPNLEPEYREDFISWMDTMAKEIASAHHFAFENVPTASDGTGGMDLPGVTSEEQDFFSEGLLPLPFEKCWFEVPAGDGGEIICYFIAETETGIDVTPFRYIGKMKALQFTAEHWTISRGVPGESVPDIIFEDPFDGAALMREAYRESGLYNISYETQVKGEAGLVMYLLLMLSSRTSEVETIPAPDKLNKARAKKGRAPIPPHRVVSIIPKGIAADIRREYGGSEGYVRHSPRMHWRRSHVRTLADGRRIPIARMLIGYKAADGREMVSHEYRVEL